MMKQVGEAVRDFVLSCSYKEGDVVTIGIATWGTVYNRESLICPMVSWARMGDAARLMLSEAPHALPSALCRCCASPGNSLGGQVEQRQECGAKLIWKLQGWLFCPCVLSCSHSTCWLI